MKQFITSNIITKRESLTLPINGKEETWDYLTIYNKNGKIIARSTNYHPEGEIRLVYEELEFVAPSQARVYGENNIYITIESIKKRNKQTMKKTTQKALLWTLGVCLLIIGVGLNVVTIGLSIICPILLAVLPISIFILVICMFTFENIINMINKIE